MVTRVWKVETEKPMESLVDEGKVKMRKRRDRLRVECWSPERERRTLRSRDVPWRVWWSVRPLRGAAWDWAALLPAGCINNTSVGTSPRYSTPDSAPTRRSDKERKTGTERQIALVYISFFWFLVDPLHIYRSAIMLCCVVMLGLIGLVASLFSPTKVSNK